MSQKQDDGQLKIEGEKKKWKTIVTWHHIECEGSRQKNKANVSVYNVTARFFVILFLIILCVFIYACMWLFILSVNSWDLVLEGHFGLFWW